MLNSEDYTQNLYFAEFKLDDEKYNKSKASGGLQYLIHIDLYRQHVEDGLNLMPGPCEDRLDLETLDHWNLYGFSHDILQSVRGLVEWPFGPCYKHRGGVRYIHDFCMYIMMSDQCKLTPHYHKEDEGDLELRIQRHRTFYSYICCIYEMIMPSHMMCDDTTFRILRNNFARLFHDADDRMSTTISRL